MNSALRILHSDLFDIGARLKAIDDGYFIAYNVLSGKFEIHNVHQRGGTLALVVPYPTLDQRTVTLCLKTRRENRDRLILEMERDNVAAQKKMIADSVAAMSLQTESLLSSI